LAPLSLTVDRSRWTMWLSVPPVTTRYPRLVSSAASVCAFLTTFVWYSRNSSDWNGRCNFLPYYWRYVWMPKSKMLKNIENVSFNSDEPSWSQSYDRVLQHQRCKKITTQRVA
jgi:hypothetical protein